MTLPLTPYRRLAAGRDVDWRAAWGYYGWRSVGAVFTPDGSPAAE